MVAFGVAAKVEGIMNKPMDFAVTLKVASGPKQGQAVPIPRLPFMIGKNAECQLRPSSDAIGPRHCVLKPGPGGLSIADLGSETGTWINGVRISSSVPIGDGDELRVGPLVFTIIVAMPKPESQRKTKLDVAATDRETLSEMPVPVEKKAAAEVKILEML